MKTVRTVPRAMGVLSLILATVLVAVPALAGKKADAGYSTTFKLIPPANAPEPRASGQWTLLHDSAMMTEDVTVSCRGLAPGRQYTIAVLVHWSKWVKIGFDPYPTDSGEYLLELGVTADAKGRLSGQCTVVSTWSPSGGVNRFVQDLWITNAAGDVVLETP